MFAYLHVWASVSATAGLRQKPLLIDGVDGQLGLFRSLHEISREHGSGAQERKRAIIARLLVAAKGVRSYELPCD